MEVDTDPAPRGPNDGPDNGLNNGPNNGLFDGPAPNDGLFNGPAPNDGLFNGPAPNNGLFNGPDNGPENGLFNGPAPNNGLFNGPAPNNGLFNGLATSRHAAAPQVAQAAQAPAETPPSGAQRPQQHPAKALLQSLVALVPENQQAVAQDLAKEVHRSYTAPGRSDDASLKKVVIEGVREALAGLPSPLQQPKQAKQAPTWATVAAAVAAPAVVPTTAPPTRLGREVLIRGAGLQASLARRTPYEIVQAVNTASVTKGAIAARKLPSGDVVVTFCNDQVKQWHSTNLQWIQQAFGTQATEAKRTTAVLVKGLRKSDLQGVIEAAF